MGLFKHKWKFSHEDTDGSYVGMGNPPTPIVYDYIYVCDKCKEVHREPSSSVYYNLFMHAYQIRLPEYGCKKWR